jgi:hypothetical protein
VEGRPSVWLLSNFSKYYLKTKERFKMKKLVAIGTFAAGVSVGFVTCGVLTVRGVLKSEKLRGAIANVVSEKVYELLDEEFDQRRKPRISYTSYYNRSPKSKVSYKSYYIRENDDSKFRNYVFETLEAAQNVLRGMEYAISNYGYVSVQDFYELCGVSSSFTDNTIGWRSALDMKVVEKDHGYIVDLPKPRKLTEAEEE